MVTWLQGEVVPILLVQRAEICIQDTAQTEALHAMTLVFRTPVAAWTTALGFSWWFWDRSVSEQVQWE